MLHGGEGVIGHDRRDVKAAWRAIFAIVRYSPWRGDDAIFGAKGKSTAHSALIKVLCVYGHEIGVNIRPALFSLILDALVARHDEIGRLAVL